MRRKKSIRDVLPVIGIIAGLCIMGAYPAIDLFYSLDHKFAARHVETAVSRMEPEDYTEYEEQAEQYNRDLASGKRQESTWPYEEQLNVEGEGYPFAELVIPKIMLDMPIYHGTSEAVLQEGVGHFKETSLPIGGTDTHTVLTAHSGMAGMRAFDDIRRLKKGDTFYISVLGKKIAYQVTGREVLLPEEVEEKLLIRKGKDLCTLITCTPYGVNDHRLMIYAERTEYTEEVQEDKPDPENLLWNIRTTPVLLGIILVIIVAVYRAHRKKQRKGKGA